MNKLAKDTPPPWGYYAQQAGKGTLTGVGIGTLLSLVHAINASRVERKEEIKRKEGDPDAITLNLPSLPKMAECVAAKGGDHKVRVVHPECKELPRSACRHFDGKFADKLAQDRSLNLGAREVARGNVLKLIMTAAAAAGVHGAYDSHRKDYLNREIDRTKAQYRRELTGDTGEDDEKLASELDKLFDFNNLEKIADGNLFDKLDREISRRYKIGPVAGIGAVALLALSAGTAGTGYLTKRVLDAHERKLQQEHLTKQLPRVNRITIRREPLPKSTQSVSDRDKDEELLTNKEANQVKAAFWIIHDIVSGRDELSKSADITTLCTKHNTSLDKIAKVLDDNEYLTTDILEAIPDELAASIVKVAEASLVKKKDLTKVAQDSIFTRGRRRLEDGAMNLAGRGATVFSMPRTGDQGVQMVRDLANSNPQLKELAKQYPEFYKQITENAKHVNWGNLPRHIPKNFFPQFRQDIKNINLNPFSRGYTGLAPFKQKVRSTLLPHLAPAALRDIGTIGPIDGSVMPDKATIRSMFYNPKVQEQLMGMRPGVKSKALSGEYGSFVQDASAAYAANRYNRARKAGGTFGIAGMPINIKGAPGYTPPPTYPGARTDVAVNRGMINRPGRAPVSSEARLTPEELGTQAPNIRGMLPTSNITPPTYENKEAAFPLSKLLVPALTVQQAKDMYDAYVPSTTYGKQDSKSVITDTEQADIDDAMAKLKIDSPDAPLDPAKLQRIQAAVYKTLQQSRLRN